MKKNYTLLFLSFSLLLISCGSVSRIDYVGSKNPVTEKVDVYVDEQAIARPYIIMGKGYHQPGFLKRNNYEKLMEKAIQKAKEKGADAIFFREVFVPTPSTTVNTRSQTDSIGKGVFSISNTSINQSPGYLRGEILFLRYNK